MTTINILFYNQLLDSMSKNIEHFKGLVDRKEAEKQELQQQLNDALAQSQLKDATISNLNGQIAQMQTGLETEEQEALVELAHKVEALNEAISGVLSPVAAPAPAAEPAPAPETSPAPTEETPAPQAEPAEESHGSLDEADAEHAEPQA
jgi:peptidoglycan hydrolase CwlO-like protein